MSADNAMPTFQYLSECFDYNPDTGVLTWKRRPLSHFASERYWKAFTSRLSGKPAGYPSGNGALLVSLRGSLHCVHRIAFALIHKLDLDQVPDEIDHRDCDASNNRAANIRPATRSQNASNQGRRANNTSGYKGVCWRKDMNRWHARIRTGGKNRSLGYFDDPAEAHAAYSAAAKELCGEYARAS